MIENNDCQVTIQKSWSVIMSEIKMYKLFSIQIYNYSKYKLFVIKTISMFSKSWIIDYSRMSNHKLHRL